MLDLETLLRDVRPEPDPQWAARLDARVAARFPSPPSRPKRAWLAFRAHFLAFGAVGAVASVLILFVVAIANMDTGSDEEPASSGSYAEPAAGIAPNTTEKAGGGESAGSGLAQQDSAAGADDRAVMRNASITLSARAGEVEGIVDRSIAIVDALGGYVESSNVSRGGDRASAELSLKIPTAELNDGLSQISKLAHVRSRSQQAQDVTGTRERLEALVRDARADRDGLRSRLAKATTDRERSRLRAALDRATRRVTQRQRAVNELGRDVSYATVALSVVGDRDRQGGAAAPGDRWTPGDAVGDAVRVLEVIAGVLVVSLAVILPVVILIVLAVLAGRVMRQRRRERALGSA